MSLFTADPVGDISLILQTAILFLLILGVPFAKGTGVKKNWRLHGYFTILALILHSILILLVMIPVFNSGLGDLAELSIFASFTVWSHVILGTLAELLGIITIGFWMAKPLSNMNCLKVKKIMIPLFIVWTISIVNGAIIHLLEVL